MPREIFTIRRVDSNDNKFTYKAEVNENSHIFKGHFEDMAVVPGVCTMTMLKQCVADALQVENVKFISIKEVKFLAMVLPDKHKSLDVNLELKGDNNIVAEVMHEQTKVMKLKATIAVL